MTCFQEAIRWGGAGKMGPGGYFSSKSPNQPMSSSNIAFCGQKLSLPIPTFIMDTFDHFDEQF